jgi:tetratricopeptide (TPR) repeat protein
LNAAATKNSDSLLFHYYAGFLYVKLEKIDDAIREFERQLTLNTDDVQAKYQLANILLTRKNPERGIALLREIVQSRPEHYSARYSLGKVLLSRRDLKPAIENLEAATRLSPENAEFHYQLGQAYLAAGRQTEGRDEITISNRLKSQTRNQSRN